jgi:hypothetical protein
MDTETSGYDLVGSRGERRRRGLRGDLNPRIWTIGVSTAFTVLVHASHEGTGRGVTRQISTTSIRKDRR